MLRPRLPLKPSGPAVDPWAILQMDPSGIGCRFCGQVHTNSMGTVMCKMCENHMNGVVYAICRELLHKKVHRNLNLTKDKKKEVPEKDKDADPTEVAIKAVLEAFPFMLAERTTRFDKARRTEGIWFAHCVAFQLIKFIRIDDTGSAQELAGADEYKTARDQVFELMSKGKPKLSPEILAAVEKMYSIPQTNFDGRRMILTMILELEKAGRLKINRPKSKCSRCGKEINGGMVLCDSCQAEDAMDVRRSIVSNAPPPISSRSDSPQPTDRRSGMSVQK